MFENAKRFFANLNPQYILRDGRTDDGVDTQVVAWSDSSSYLAEQYKTLCGKLMHLDQAKELKSILLTSCQPGEGKTTTACNLGVTVASTYKENVVIVDTDLRRPSLHSMFGISRTPGLSDVLTGKASLDEVMVTTSIPNLTLIPAGNSHERPAQLLNSDEARQIIKDLEERFDLVILDSPPVLKVADATIVGGYCDAVLFVVRAGATPAQVIQEGFELLEGTPAKPRACILANVRTRPNYYSYLTNSRYRNYYATKYSPYDYS